MCNRYALTTSQAAIRQAANAMRDLTGNLAAQPGIFPDQSAPVIRTGEDGVRELAMARWGLPSPSRTILEAAGRRADRMRSRGERADLHLLLKDEPDRGLTNIRHPESLHWRPYQAAAQRCLVPFTSFSEFNRAAGGDIWFALSDDRPLAFFAGLWRGRWTGVRALNKGRETLDLFGFLTCPPNAEVEAVHPKAMPVILTEDEDLERWLSAPWAEARSLQRPLADGALSIVKRGAPLDDA
ncbi:SOS response-associated peptidase [Brevundimonas sp.]|uniref:SOS response-associated peptidase n=1 Tax=Brevundimonas sp. TaxID=1871086 RepID=UPI00289B739C|nr:SOS response-associated peptidase [Brevundimonas sp.]